MKKLAYLGGVAAAALLATTTVSYAKDEKPAAAAPAAEKKAAAPEAKPAAAAPKADPAKPAAGAPAQPAKPADPKAAEKAAPPVEAPKPAAPKPAPEVDAFFQAQKGNWKCTGTMNGMDGKAVPMTYTISSKLDLDKFWIVTSMASKKTKENPVVFKFTAYTTYDAAAKKWVRIMVDNWGGWEQDTSSGLTGTTVTWEGKSTGMGHTMSTKHVEEMKGPKEMTASGTMSMDGKNWMPMYDATCKK